MLKTITVKDLIESVEFPNDNKINITHIDGLLYRKSSLSDSSIYCIKSLVISTYLSWYLEDVYNIKVSHTKIYNKIIKHSHGSSRCIDKLIFEHAMEIDCLVAVIESCLLGKSYTIISFYEFLLKSNIFKELLLILNYINLE